MGRLAAQRLLVAEAVNEEAVMNHLDATRAPSGFTDADAEVALDRWMAVEPEDAGAGWYRGAGRDYGPLRIYGGHLLGQALAAAFATVAEPMLAHSLHAYFLATGAPSEPIDYRVERLRDGNRYAARAVRACQGERTLLMMTASFKIPEPGDQHQPAAPAVPSPEEAIGQRLRAGRPPLALPFSAGFGVALEPVDDWSPVAPAGGAPAIAMWMRAVLTPEPGPRARQCALAYLSDGSLMFNALRPHGTAFASHRATSLDHCLWFHHDADPAGWLLYDQQGPVAADSRGLNHGRIFDRGGRLVASAMQEGMMRRG
jgi:acyl-CoA thioesterase II